MIDKETINSKLKNPYNFLPYWKEIIILILLLIFIITFWRLDEKNKQLQNELNSRASAKTVEKINSGVSSVTEREKKVYPKIDNDIENLNRNIKATNTIIEKIEKSKPTKEQSYAKFKNQDIETISKYFANRGYTNAIFNRISSR